MTQAGTLTPTGSYQPITAGGSISFGDITAGEAGDLLVLINTSSNTITITDTGTLKPRETIFATGAWSPLLQGELGCRIPVQPGKGYSMTMVRPEQCPKYPMIFEEHRVAVTPLTNAYRLGSTMEFAGYDASLNRKRLGLLSAGARHYLHTPTAEPVLEEWTGWRPMSCDGKPIIGRIPRLNNAWLATGHSMLGLSMATGTGKLVAQLLTGQPTHIDPHPYRVDRF